MPIIIIVYRYTIYLYTATDIYQYPNMYICLHKLEITLLCQYDAVANNGALNLFLTNDTLQKCLADLSTTGNYDPTSHQ